MKCFKALKVESKDRVLATIVFLINVRRRKKVKHFLQFLQFHMDWTNSTDRSRMNGKPCTLQMLLDSNNY